MWVVTRSCWPSRRAHSVALLVLLLGLGGCSVPVARDLDETSANHVVVALERGGVTTSKEPDSQSEGKWIVSVRQTDAPFAIGILSREGLPARERPGVAESVGQGSLIPSLQSEQARLLAGIAGDLERSLTSIDGVVSARVHLAVPATDPLVEIAEHSVPSASVLIRHHGLDSPVPTLAIQRLVAGAVAGLTEDRVAVVMTRVVESSVPERKIVSFGPFAVTRESAGALRWFAGGFVGLNLTTLILLLIFWKRARKATLGRPTRPAHSPGEPP